MFNGDLGKQTSPLWMLSTSFPLSPALCAEQNPIWCGIFLGSVKASCYGCVPSQILVHPQTPHWWGGVRKGFDSVSALLRHDKDILELSTLFPEKNPNHSSIPATVEKMNSIPAQSRTVQVDSTFGNQVKSTGKTQQCEGSLMFQITRTIWCFSMGCYMLVHSYLWDLK